MAGNRINIDELVRPNIRDLSPYRSARDDFDSGLLLDANENAFGSPFDGSLQLNRYPSPTQDPLRKRVAAFRGVDHENIFLGVGSDEPIDLLIRIFCKPGEDAILITPPTYGMYKVSARINDVAVKSVLLDESLQPDPDAILSKADARTKILFLCSPNNPTGNFLERERMIRLIGQFPGIVVLDEAYIDFSSEKSAAGLVEKYPNLVVLQTLSKSFGMAGVRLGIAIADVAVIRYMMKVKAPYNINKLTADTALQAFDKLGQIQATIEKVIAERKRLAKALSGMKAVRKVFPSDANFLLFRIDDALEVYRELASRGVIIRYRGNEPRCEDCLRVTVGMPEENERFLSTLKQVLP